MSIITAEITSKKGFYIGDICYVLGDRLYRGVWGDKYGFNDGSFTDPDTGLQVAVAGTAYGDGTYTGSDGTEYPVDAGNIGLVPLELVEDQTRLEEGKVIKAPGTATFQAEDGVFEIHLPDGQVVAIDTEHEEEDEEDECWEDDEEEWDEEDEDE